MTFRNWKTVRRGAVLMMLIVSLAVVGVMIVAVARMFVARRNLQLTQEQHLQSALLAQAGVERGAALLTDDPDFAGQTWAIPAEQLGGRSRAQVKITIAANEDSPTEREISAKAALGEDAETAVKYARLARLQLKSP
jgi:hypothetical protein